ncbi:MULTISPECIES: hypothetical protein [unclassified Micromonospora]|uniref:hypothetical protein n=1 Tax=unclassified Micromonospora TaxID=2617518 RepID=UPI0036371E82
MAEDRRPLAGQAEAGFGERLAVQRADLMADHKAVYRHRSQQSRRPGRLGGDLTEVGNTAAIMDRQKQPYGTTPRQQGQRLPCAILVAH